MIKIALKYIFARAGEPSSMAGLGVLFLVLERITGLELDLLAAAVGEALPAILTGNWVGALLIVVPALIAMLKADAPKPKGPPDPRNAQFGAEKHF